MLVSGDFNKDGKPDLAFSSPVGNAVAIHLNSGSGSFSASAPIAIPAGSNPAYLAVADLNGDGRQDLVTANQGNDTASLLLGNGTGGFTVGTPLTTGSSPRNLVVADLNGDKLLDLAVSNGLANTVSVFLQRCQ